MNPPHGKWLICGYGQFGKAVVRNLRREGIELGIVEADPEKTGCDDCIEDHYTEAEILLAEGSRNVVGIDAGFAPAPSIQTIATSECANYSPRKLASAAISASVRGLAMAAMMAVLAPICLPAR